MSKKVFICASESEEDQKILNRLDTHLSDLRRSGQIIISYGNSIAAGTEWKKEITRLINEADIILLLISADFWASDFCHDFVLVTALKRANKRGTKPSLIPVLARAFAWEESDLSKYTALPNKNIPIASHSWKDVDKPYKFIVDSLKKLIKGKAIVEYKAQEDKIPPVTGNTIITGIGNITGDNNQVNINGGVNIGNTSYISGGSGSKSPEHNAVANNSAFINGNKTYRLGRYEEAIAYYETALQQLPNDSAVYFNLGQCYRKMKEFDKALDYYNQALAINPKRVDTYMARGYLKEEHINDLEGALSDYKSAIQYNPTQAHAYFRIAHLLYTKQDRPDEALAYYKKCTHYKPSDRTAHYNIGVLLYKQGNYKEALHYFARTVDLDLNYHMGYTYLGYTFYALKDFRSARKHFDTSLKINPDQPKVKEFRKKADDRIWW